LSQPEYAFNDAFPTHSRCLHAHLLVIEAVISSLDWFLRPTER
jgi:hypothetical protein